MKLELNIFDIENIRFDEKTAINEGILFPIFSLKRDHSKDKNLGFLKDPFTDLPTLFSLKLLSTLGLNGSCRM